MFGKNFFMILVFVLFILQISFVYAQSDNQTEIINESNGLIEYCENSNSQKLIENSNSQKFENKFDNKNYPDKLEFYQGIIPIHIDSPVWGEFKVLVDDKEYEEFYFDEENEMIYLPTFNSKHFPTVSEIDVGLHNFSLSFNFSDFVSRDVNVFFDENSTLTFKFNENYFSPMTTSYVFNSTLNILKKEKTIHIVDFSFPSFIEDLQFSIRRDNLEKDYKKCIWR